MAELKKKVSENSPGKFFVDLSCINCGACRKFAHDIFDEQAGHSFVRKQPSSESDNFKTMQTLVACPVNAIGATSKKIPRAVVDSFPVEIAENI